MAFSCDSSLIQVADNASGVPTFTPFDATTVTPMIREDVLAGLAIEAEKTQQQLEEEKKERLLWGIAENKLLNESSRVQALRLLHEIQMTKNGMAGLLARIAELEAKLSRKKGNKRFSDEDFYAPKRD
jgi:hypothetical protein